MKLLAFVPIKLTLLLIIGILIAYYFPFDIRFSLGITLALLVVLGFLFSYQKKPTSTLFGVIAALTTISLGALIYQQGQPKNSSSHYSKLAAENQVLWQLKIKEVLKPTSFAQRYMAIVKNANNEVATANVLLNKKLDTTTILLQVDDEIWVNSEIIATNPPINPYQFNYKNYLEQLGIYHQINIDSKDYFISESKVTSIYGLAAKTRNHILEKLRKVDFGIEEFGVIQALLLGQRSDISQETYDNYDLIFCDPPTFSNSKMRDMFDVSKDQRILIHQCMHHLNQDGTLLFSTNYRKFKLDEEILEEYDVEDISEETIPEDFKRNTKIHYCFKIQHKRVTPILQEPKPNKKIVKKKEVEPITE